ncbi:MAG: twin-arginine translocase subunit TatC [Bacteroidetes bacterium CG12_big_fil_rev_8_21_14_0_65_60_17]|nr:MAG: twin-arginine translocase subunit TatC [Bacteroidetes bacterium CG12_big_fil_rev_8_21_14_0_65_60_17]
MGFLDHLEELRWSLIKGFGGILACTAVASVFRRWIIQNVVLAPKNPDFISYRIFGVETTPFVIQNRTITGQFFTDWGTALVVGAIVGSPLFIYQMWRFIEPGLYSNEKQGLRFSAVFATFFFILGISFGYFVITPLALQFFAAYQISPEIQNEFDITKYFEMITFWSFGTGLLFQLPVVVYFLAKLGIATPQALRVARKYALLVALILSAFFTPPDPVSQILVAMPLMLLYEMSIWIAVVVEKRRKKALQAA